MKKLKTNGRSFLIASLLILGVGVFMASPVSAQYCSLQKSALGYSTVGVLVLKETLHATGYSYSQSGYVSAMWLTTDRCWWPNIVSEERTWKGPAYNGEYAYGSFKVSTGINSPWGVVSLFQKTHVLRLYF